MQVTTSRKPDIHAEWSYFKKTDKFQVLNKCCSQTHKLLVAMQNVIAISGKECGRFLQSRSHAYHTIQESYSCLPKWNKSASSIKDLYLNIHSILSNGSPTWKQPERFQVSDKLVVLHATMDSNRTKKKEQYVYN